MEDSSGLISSLEQTQHVNSQPNDEVIERQVDKDELKEKFALRERYNLFWFASRLTISDKLTNETCTISEKKAKVGWGESGIKKAPQLMSVTNEYCDNFNYRWYIDNKLNLNFPITTVPKAGDTSFTTGMLKKFFGEFYEPVMDCIALKVQNPKIKLPIMLLLSEENGTGKTTIAEYVCSLFERNAAKPRMSDLTSNFNANWIGAQIVMIDEAYSGDQSKYQINDKIKDLVTGGKQMWEEKHAAKKEINCNIWMWFCSNKIHNALYIDDNDERIWPIKANIIEGEKYSREDLWKKLDGERPAMLKLFLDRKVVRTKHRLHVDPALYKTELKKDIIDNNKNSLTRDIERGMTDLFLRCPNAEEIVLCKEEIVSTCKLPSNIPTAQLDLVLNNEFNTKYSGCVKGTATGTRHIMGGLTSTALIPYKYKGGYLFKKSRFSKLLDEINEIEVEKKADIDQQDKVRRLYNGDPDKAEQIDLKFKEI